MGNHLKMHEMHLCMSGLGKYGINQHELGGGGASTSNIRHRPANIHHYMTTDSK